LGSAQSPRVPNRFVISLTLTSRSKEIIVSLRVTHAVTIHPLPMAKELTVSKTAGIEELQQLISSKSLADKFNLPVKEIRILECEDKDGEPAYKVWVVFSNNAKDEFLSLAKTSPLRRSIRETLYKASGYARFPYLWVAKKKDVPEEILSEAVPA
jgi:hypothetical protein